MKIPQDALIPDAKLTRYLLISRSYDDKSKFLAQADFTLENSDELLMALRQIIQIGEAIEDRIDQYGVYYRFQTRRNPRETRALPNDRPQPGSSRGQSSPR